MLLEKNKMQALLEALSILMVLMLFAGCSHYKNPVDAPFADDEWKNKKATEAIMELEEAGFSNIEHHKAETDNVDDDDKIAKITIDGKEEFDKGDRYEGDVPVVVTYSALRMVSVPFDSDEWKGKKAEEIIEELESAGFSDVERIEEETHDVSNDNEIIKITINGEEEFDKNSQYKINVPVVVEYYTLRKIDATMRITVGGEEGQPKFTVKTNLPDGVIITMTLQNEDDYSIKQVVEVKNGIATSGPFRKDAGPLEGSYTLTAAVLMDDQTSAGKSELGTKGECLAGTLVKTDAETGDKYLTTYYAYTSDYEKSVKISEKEMRAQLAKAMSAGFDDNYKISLEGYLYTISVWQDGTADVALLATYGYPNAVEAWNSMADSTAETSEYLQKMLYAAGYEDYMIQLQVLNDLNKENVLLTAMFGMVTYNCVSE